MYHTEDLGAIPLAEGRGLNWGFKQGCGEQPGRKLLQRSRHVLTRVLAGMSEI